MSCLHPLKTLSMGDMYKKKKKNGKRQERKGTWVEGLQLKPPSIGFFPNVVFIHPNVLGGSSSASLERAYASKFSSHKIWLDVIHSKVDAKCWISCWMWSNPVFWTMTLPLAQSMTNLESSRTWSLINVFHVCYFKKKINPNRFSIIVGASIGKACVV